MNSPQVTTSISTVIQGSQHTISISYQYPQIETPEELSQLFSAKSLITLLNLTSELSLKDLATKLSRSLARQNEKTLLETCYSLLCEYPLHLQQSALEAYKSNPALLQMFSFDPSSIPSSSEPKPKRTYTRKTKTPNPIAEQLAALKSQLK